MGGPEIVVEAHATGDGLGCDQSPNDYNTPDERHIMIDLVNEYAEIEKSIKTSKKNLERLEQRIRAAAELYFQLEYPEGEDDSGYVGIPHEITSIHVDPSTLMVTISGVRYWREEADGLYEYTFPIEAFEPSGELSAKASSLAEAARQRRTRAKQERILVYENALRDRERELYLQLKAKFEEGSNA